MRMTRRWLAAAAAWAMACGGSMWAAETELEQAWAAPQQSDAYVLETVTPKYPHEMRQRGVQGRTLLKLRVNEQGEVDAVQVVASTNPAFSEAAKRSVSKWYFEPGRREGVPVAQTVMVPVNFLIEGLPNATVASL